MNHCLDNGNGDGNFKWFIIFDNCVLDDDCSDEFVLVNFIWLRIDEQWFIADNDRQTAINHPSKQDWGGHFLLFSPIARGKHNFLKHHQHLWEMV